MSSRGHRTYGGRKKAVSQFDKLISDVSNKHVHHPVASKTTGHVGKWGMTSYTSIRSSTMNGPRTGKNDHIKKSLSNMLIDSFNKIAEIERTVKFY